MAQIAWADAALRARLAFYHRLVVHTSDIKLVVQSCLKKVRRAACGIISLCISHIIEQLSFPAKTNTEATFQRRLKKEEKKKKKTGAVKEQGEGLDVVRFFWPPSTCKRCKWWTAAEEELSLRLSL